MGKEASNQGYRYERKFSVSELTRHEIESLVRLHPAMFSEIYHERFVNNIYFDSFDKRYYSHAVSGLNDRLKIRVRWYGDLFGVIEKPILELKIKDGLLGRKELYPLVAFALDGSFQPATIVDVIKRSAMSGVLKEGMASLELCLLNRYRRNYFESADRKYRITIDSDLEFYQIGACSNAFLHQSVDPVTTVVELKYGSEEEDGVERITAWFPFRLGKSSKYVTGVERLWLW